MRRQLIATTFTLLALAFSVLPGKAAVWAPPEIYDAGLNKVGVQIVDTFFNTGEQVSTLQALPFSQMGQFAPGSRLCVRVGVAPCNQTDQMYTAVLLLPACTTATQQWCIESLGVRNKNQPLAQAKFIRQVDAQTVEDTPGDGIPGGSSMSLWQAAGVKNGGGADTYAAYVMIRATKNPGRNFFVSDFSAMIFPYSEKRGSEFSRAMAQEGALPTGQLGVQTLGVSTGCAWTENNLCGVLEDFPADTRASMTLRVSNQLTGWLMGRMSDPIIEVQQFDMEQNRISIDAEPVLVPKLYALVDQNQVTPAMRASLGNPQANFTGVQNLLANYPNSFDIVDAWKDAAKDKAAGLVTTWSASTVKFGMGSFCLADTSKLLGVVTTNAMVYEGTAPAFENGTLNYRVGGMHYNPDGSVFQGSYDLVMRKSAAQCLYGFTDAPITATVTVVEAGKEQRIETSSLQELGTGENKWLKLSARGFTFSSPTLKIKLNQDKPAVAAPSPSTSQESTAATTTATPAVKPAKKLASITCVKGKLTRKVTGASPKCPAGYKKK